MARIWKVGLETNLGSFGQSKFGSEIITEERVDSFLNELPAEQAETLRRLIAEKKTSLSVRTADHGCVGVAIALVRASEIAPEYKPVFVATREIVELLDIAVEQQVERTTADQAVEDAIVIAEASMGEAAGAAAEFEAADEAERLKAADEAVVEAMRERLMENAAWAAANPDLATHGFVLNVLWVSRYEITEQEKEFLRDGCPGAVRVHVEWMPSAGNFFWNKRDEFIIELQKEAAKVEADIVAGDWTPEQALRLGIEATSTEEPYGLRVGIRNDSGSFRVVVI
jgi:hypothetical protein